jgi:gluconolactonase
MMSLSKRLAGVTVWLSVAVAWIGCLRSISASDVSMQERLRKVEVNPFAKAPGYSEGPTWVNGELFFCSGALLKVDQDGRVTKHLDINPGGTVLLGNGNLLIADNKHRGLVELTPDGKASVLVDSSADGRFKGLNDLTIDARGNVYFSDPEGSNAQSRTGRVWRFTASGKLSLVAEGLAFPNGLDVDPQSKFLYVVESQSKKVLRYALPESDDSPLGAPTDFYNLGGSGGDGCAFDADSNLWTTDFHRPETEKGRIIVLSPKAEVLGMLDIPAKVVSNICFGGPNHDEIFCTTGTPDGVFHAKVGVKGFRGHPSRFEKPGRPLKVSLMDGASSVSPRKFGVPGGIGVTRGWYVWHRWDAKTGIASVSKEEADGPGEPFETLVLPWATTYRHLVYGASFDELNSGERVNLFFNPEGDQRRAYLVHFQDELCQMKGHAHAWEVRTIATDGKSFTAQAMAADKPLEDRERSFEFAGDAKFWREGKNVSEPSLKIGERLFLTWCYSDKRRQVHVLSDDASLEVIKQQAAQRVAASITESGLRGFMDQIDGREARVAIFSTYWSQAGQLKPDQKIRLQQVGDERRATGILLEARLVSRKNLGTYGSGVTEIIVQFDSDEAAKKLRPWLHSMVTLRP